MLTNDHEYLPLKKGWYQVYEVEETTYVLGTSTTRHYQLKTHVADSFPNAEGGFTYVIHRSVRSDDNETWTPEETWSARLTAREAVVSEGSTPYVVLHFPLSVGGQWDGNAFNDEVNPNTNEPRDFYQVESLKQSCEVNSLYFSDCLDILQEDNDEFIVFHDERRERYARGVGLVYKERIQLHYCNDEDRNCVGEQIVDEGVIYKQEISAYGQE